MACCALPSYDPQTKQIQNGVSCVGCHIAFYNKLIGLTLASGAEDPDMVYSRDSFLTHFASCGHAQLLWKASNCGTIQPPEWPSSCIAGGYFRRREG